MCARSGKKMLIYLFRIIFQVFLERFSRDSNLVKEIRGKRFYKST